MRNVVLVLSLAVVACGGGNRPSTTPTAAVALTPDQIDSLWTRAEGLLANRKWTNAIIAFERLQLELPTRDPRRPAARFMIAEARLGEGSNLQAVREFRRVADDFASDSLAPESLKRAADAYSRLWRRAELDPTYGMQAMATYQEVQSRFPGTPAAAASGVRIRELEDMFALKTYKAAQFYIRYNARDSAILYLKDLVATYPRAAIVPDALERLVETYQALGYVEEVSEACAYFRRTHPEAANLEATCPIDGGAKDGG
jgi:outer membrane protein assembly factor BamD